MNGNVFVLTIKLEDSAIYLNPICQTSGLESYIFPTNQLLIVETHLIQEILSK